MRPLTPVATAAAVLAGTGAASAHAVAPEAARALAWTWDPLVLGALAVALVWYAAGAARVYSRLGTVRPIGAGPLAAFACGMLAFFLALVTPLHAAGEQLLSAHMAQHLVLMFVAPPLLVWGRPALVFLWAFPPARRKRIARRWLSLGLARAVRALMHPAVVWSLFCGGFVLWHVPRLYQWALHDELVHTAEHLSFFITALMFWSIVIEPSGRRRLGHGATLLLIAHTAVLSGMPGALIALAPRPLYPDYAGGVAAWGMTLMQDQQLAGVIMWIPSGLAYLVAASVIFVRWLADSERRSRVLVRGMAPAVLVALVPLLLAGCGDEGAQAASTGGDSARGAALIRNYGCGACHTIPGIENAQGLVGPPLTHIGRRIYIAGMLRNTPANMATWLRDPQKVVPGNAMPDMGIGERDARDVTAYLYTLR